jgi:hypothetical protein
MIGSLPRPGMLALKTAQDACSRCLCFASLAALKGLPMWNAEIVFSRRTAQTSYERLRIRREEEVGLSNPPTGRDFQDPMPFAYCPMLR